MVKNCLLFIIAIFFGISCSSEKPDKTGASIQIDGSSTVFPITEAVAEEFRSKHPNIEVTVSVSGTGGGFQKFLKRNIDINNASREIEDKEIKIGEKDNLDYAQLTIGYDGLAVVVHPKNDWAEYLTVDELEKIWKPTAQNSITHWSDVRKEWPEKELNLYAPGIASGTYDFFTEVVVGESGKSRGDFTSSEDDNVLVQGVASDPNSLGFFGFAYYKEDQQQLKLLGIDDGAGEPVKPSVKTISNGEYTPFTRPLFIYVHREAAQKEAVQQFVNFYLERAPEIVAQVGYVPLPDSAYQEQKKKFEAFTSGKSNESLE